MYLNIFLSHIQGVRTLTHKQDINKSEISNNSTIHYPIDVINIAKSSRIKPQYNNNKYLTCTD